MAVGTGERGVAVSVASRVQAQAIRTPSAPALRWQDRSVTYTELRELAAKAAAHLTGVPTGGAPVALRADKSPETVAAVLACLTVEQPVLLLSTDLGPQVFDALVAEAGCAAVISVDGADLRVRPVSAPPQAPALPPDTCLLLTTSGSTGLPKIVPLPAAGIGRFVDWAAAQFGLTEGTRVLNYAPLNFDLCLLDVWATLCHGGEVVLVDPARAVQPRYLLKLFADARPEVVQAVPMLFRLLTEASDGRSFPEVRHVLLTGDHTPRRVRAGLPSMFPGAALHNVYGCTETNDSFLYTFGPQQAVEDDPLPLGRPIPGVEAAVVDHGAVVTGPGTGELVVATPFQADGYLGDAAPGGRFFRRVTDSGERTWYRTGDLVRRAPDGRLTLIGRNDLQVKVRGVRVNVEEIERVIQAHEGVVEAVVVPLPDPGAGTRLHAVVRTVHSGPSGLALRTHCAARLTRVAIPDAFRLVDEPLPVGPTDKVDRHRVRDHLMRELL
ncbi:hypothetical protein ADK66_28550 [Micromonospora sp. NRRL B-16802]|nr:hypothetical protein ADK66_28550 [Micromonospora sp. NRRL B-16802]